MKFALRRAGPGDGLRLAVLGQATFLESYAGQLASDDILAHCARHHLAPVYEDWLADERMLLWLAEAAEGGAPIGYAVCGPVTIAVVDPRPGDLELRRIYVLHRFHGAGVGRALMSAVLDAARGVSGGRVLLGVYARNALALSFYRKVGFRPVGERKFLVCETWCDDLVMSIDP